jgi:hypothetical protein
MTLKTKALFIYNDIYAKPIGGRKLFTKTNYEIINQLYKKKIINIKLQNKNKKNICYYLNSLRGRIDGINKNSIEKINNIVQKEKINQIIIDGSNLGEISKILKKNYPNIFIYTFFHNVEAIFFWQAFIALKSLKSFFVMLINYFCERKSIKYSNFIVVLNQRDSDNLKLIYSRKADYICPIILKDIYKKKRNKKINQRKLCALFVGSAFYGNILGITWFIKKVLPGIDLQLLVVGKGFEKYKKNFLFYKNVKIIGSVKNIGSWYSKAHLVVAPIFHGSGMKTKIAESMMFGKKIFATREALFGYKKISNKICHVCNNSKSFIQNINKQSNNLIKKSFHFSSRNIFLKKYSYNAGLYHYNKIFSKNNLK